MTQTLLMATLLPFLAALAGAVWVRRYSATAGLVDRPNHRSSHCRPTPSGGGIGILLGVCGGWLGLAVIDAMPAVPWLMLLGPGVALALVGLVDDVRGVPSGMRLVAQISATLAPAVILLDGWIVAALAVPAWVWLINLYNFMDGTDGLAASQGVMAALGAGGLLIAGGTPAWAPVVVVAAGCAGFLCINWPPARLFMGDVGSYFLGYLFGGLALYTSAVGDMSVWVWIILMGVLVADATTTLLLRVVRRERWWTAHRLHAYQRLADLGLGHGGVLIAVTCVTLLWLFPMAFVARIDPIHAPSIAAAALLPLVLAVLGVDRYVGRRREVA